jgi:lipoprotein NlpI
MSLRLLSLAFATITAMSCAAQADDVDDQIKAAQAALKDGDAPAAIKAASKAIELAPDKPAGYLLRGQALGSQRKSQDAIKDFDKALTLNPKLAAAYSGRGGERFKLGKIKESIEDFDRQIELDPKSEESHWRRGISYYYAGRFEDGAKQFELGKVVYGADVENSFWHYLCLARKDNAEKARKSLLKVGLDRRIPMMKIYDLIQGKAKAEDVIKTAEDAKLDKDDKEEAIFYAHLYVGLNYEAEGDAKKALEHMEKADTHKIGHYMWDVAHVHLMLAKKGKK